jgi:PKD repeat protein
MRWLALLALALGAGCDDEMREVDGAMPPIDAKLDDLGISSDGGVVLSGLFTIVGCAKLEVSGASPLCSGPAPLTLTFVPLVSGVSTFVWTFAGGDPPTSRAITPTSYFAHPGVYTVTLAAGGPAGTTTATGTVTVTAGGTGAPCLDSGDCDVGAGLACVCGQGAGCPGALGAGLCTRDCAGALCGSGEVCADLTRGVGLVAVEDGGIDDAAVSDPWRRALCLPACNTTSDCPMGLGCHEVPALGPGAPAGGLFSWRRACFADVLGEVGDSCDTPSGDPDPTRCFSGRCDPLGARGMCTADCVSSGCPSTAACASFNGAPASHLCLLRCTATGGCNDPLLDCEPPGQPGALGFSVAVGEPPDATYCAPRRCSQPSDCAPAGSCTVVGGGSFCTRS